MKRFFKFLAVLATSIFILLFILNILIDNPYTYKLFRVAINEKIKSSTNVRVDFEAVSLSILPLGVDLYGNKVSLLSPEGKAHIIAQCSHIKMRVSFLSLFLGSPKLSSVVVTDLQAQWPSPWNFPPILRNDIQTKKNANDDAPTWPPSFDLPIQKISLVNAGLYIKSYFDVRIPEQESHVATVLDGVNASIYFNNWSDIEYEAKVSSIDIARDEASILESANLDLVGKLTKNSFDFERLSIKGERVDLLGGLSGKINTKKDQKSIKSVSTQLKLKTNFDFSLLGSFLDLADTRGNATSQAVVDFEFPTNGNEPLKFKASGNLALIDGYLSGFKLFDSSSDFVVSKERLDLKKINLDIDGKNYGNFDGYILFDDEVQYSFWGEPSNLHFVDLMSALNVDLEIFDFGLTSKNFKLSGKGEPFTMSITSDALLSEIRVPAVENDGESQFNPPSCNIAMNLQVNSEYLQLGLHEGNCFNHNQNKTAMNDPKLLNKNNDIDVEGVIHFDQTGLDLKVNTEHFNLNLAQYFSQLPMEGTAKIRTRIFGPYDNIQVDNRFSVIDTKIAEMPFGKLTGKVNVHNLLLKWHDLASNINDESLIQSNIGSFSFENFNLVTKLRVDKISSGIVKQYIDVLSSGQNPGVSFFIDRLDANIKGNVFKPGQILGTLEANLLDITLDKEKIADKLSAAFTSRSEGIVGNYFDVFIGDVLLNAAIEHSRRKRSTKSWQIEENIWDKIGLSSEDLINIKIGSKHIGSQSKFSKVKESSKLENDDQLRVLPFIGEHLKEIELQGGISLTSELSGTLSHLQGTVAGKIERLSLLGSSMAPLNFKGFINGSLVDTTFDHSGNSLKGRISADLAKDGVPYEWYFSFNQFDLRAFAGENFYNDARNYIYLDAEWTMKGYFSSWWDSIGIFDIKSLSGKYFYDSISGSKSLAINSKKSSTIDIGPTGWTFKNDDVFVCENELLKVNLRLKNNRPPENFDVQLDAKASIEIAKIFISQLESASGSIDVNMNLFGPIDDLKIAAHFQDEKRPDDLSSTWEPLSVGILDLRPAFKNMRFDIDYKEGEIIVNEFVANKGNGNIVANGRFSLFDKKNVESGISAKLNNISLSYPVPLVKSFDSVIDGSITISGGGAPYRIGGNLNIVRARSTRPIDLRKEIVEALQKRSISVDNRHEDPMFNFEININGEQSIVVRNRNIDGVFSTNLRLSGNDVSPELSGQVEMNRGTFSYQQKFAIQRGIITFDDPVRPDPSIDIVAVADVVPYRVHVNISGKASNPIVDFSVDPPTDEEGQPITNMDALILLSRGKLPKSRDTSDPGAVVTAEAVNLFVGQIQQPLEKLLDLSGQKIIRQVYVDIYASEKDGSPLPRANVPINIKDDLDIIVSSDVSSAGVSVEYPLNESITVSGKYKKLHDSSEDVVDTNADTGVDLKFRFALP
ncbi:MAG: translocation/assembly module TamB domain-containing protein [Bdellovibrionota bacterium]